MIDCLLCREVFHDWYYQQSSLWCRCISLTLCVVQMKQWGMWQVSWSFEQLWLAVGSSWWHYSWYHLVWVGNIQWLVIMFLTMSLLLLTVKMSPRPVLYPISSALSFSPNTKLQYKPPCRQGHNWGQQLISHRAWLACHCPGVRTTVASKWNQFEHVWFVLHMFEYNLSFLSTK